MTYTLPELPYAYDALEPHIDEQTMRIHHTKHHNGYVTKLNKALENHSDFQQYTIEYLLRYIHRAPETIKTSIRNNGGGHANHSLFWQIMSPDGGGEPTGDLAQAIQDQYGSFQDFKETFTDTALTHFGSGWAWLVLDAADNLLVISTPNQDSPFMYGYKPLLGIDMWEHAFYLKHQNDKASYVAAWWNVVNWKEVQRQFTKPALHTR